MYDTLQILNSTTVWAILVRFAINLVFLIVLIGFIYFKYSKKERFLFTFFLIGIIVFLICSIMKEFDIGIGMAFGLFAIFGILRLRTRNFGIKDMAYLFTTIGLSVINALGMLVLPFIGILIINVIVLFSTYILEEVLTRNMFQKQSIIYDNLGLLNPASRQKLLKDISSRTGQKVFKVKIRKTDFKKEVAEIDIFFKE